MAKNKDGMIPRQKYELIEVSKFGIENGTALVCEDCGRTIFNFATIRGCNDGKTYTVGLTCVKKLLKINHVSFGFEDEMKLESEEYLFNQAANAKKWLCKTLKQLEDYNPCVKIVDFVSHEGDNLFCIEIKSGKDRGSFKKGWRLGTSISMQQRFKAFFNEFKN